MGLYINPTTGTKEEWLADNALRVRQDRLIDAIIDDTVDFKNIYPLVLLDNGPFTALSVGYSDEETKHFMLPDGRNKLYYTATKEVILDVCPQAADYLN